MSARNHLISLGSWCRPAHNLRRYAEYADNFESVSGPFDWTITSFASLRACMSEEFDPNAVLNIKESCVSFARSGMCGRTGLIFHHALDPVFLGKIGSFSPGQKLPECDVIVKKLDDARGRFIYTFGKFRSLGKEADLLVFVRWRRFGHPDKVFPQAFEEETNNGLISCIGSFLGHDRFRLLVITSELVPDRREPFENPLVELHAEGGQWISCRIRERKGWNGDQSNNFKGDEHAWKAALDAAFDTWDL